MPLTIGDGANGIGDGIGWSGEDKVLETVEGKKTLLANKCVLKDSSSDHFKINLKPISKGCSDAVTIIHWLV